MKLNFIIFVVVLVLCVKPFSVLSQKQESNFELQLYGIPYYKLANYIYENRMQWKSEYFRSDYSQRINQEVGFSLKYNLKKWKFGIGASYNNYNYAHSVYLIDYNNYVWSDLNFRIYQQLNVKAIGISVLGERKLNKTISLGIRLSMNTIIDHEYGVPAREYEFSNDISNFDLKEDFYPLNNKVMVIPEVYLSKKINKNIDLILGYKLKFYSRFYEPGNELYKLTIRSDFGSYYEYTIDTYQTGFFFGASYTFQLPKLRKSKVE